ncbi:hypothetical protein HDL76_16175 [Bordetella pertussis]|nr:hypothetical protein HDL76_16175 [Bordetella pertussis]
MIGREGVGDEGKLRRKGIIGGWRIKGRVMRIRERRKDIFLIRVIKVIRGVKIGVRGSGIGDGFVYIG